MHDHHSEFRVTAMSRVLEVGASGYYRWRGRKPSAREVENERLVEKIKATHAESRSTYGSPKIYRKLRQAGETVNHKRVARLMKKHGLKAKRVKKFKRTTDSRHSLPVAENVLARDFKTTRPDTVWASDITYVWTAEGWLYLVVFLDLFSRLVVGWAVSASLETEFVEAAFIQGQRRRGGAVAPLVHSDRGSQARKCGVQSTPSGVGLSAEHEPESQLLGQRGQRKFLRHFEKRVGASRTLRHETRSEGQALRLYRSLLQPDEDSFGE